MAQRHKAQGWSLRRKGPNGVWCVRCNVKGREIERSTGERDHADAAAQAPLLYAQIVSDLKHEAPRPRRIGSQDLTTLIALWLASLTNTHAPTTRKVWEGYASAIWLEFFGSLSNMTAEWCGEYMRQRLGKVLRATLRKELCALRSFLAWAVEFKYLPRPVALPKIPPRAPGTASARGTRVAAPAVSREQVAAFLAALPEWSDGSNRSERFPVRARFIVQYETSLRPSTLARLRVPEHYRPGERVLRLSLDTDKARWGRDVPLTARARDALDSVLLARQAGRLALGVTEPFEGLIFGEHDYTDFVHAARRVLPPEIRDRFQGAHLRSAAITHRLERGASLPGVQFLAGHKLMSTTSKYVRPSFRAAEEALGEDLGQDAAE